MLDFSVVVPTYNRPESLRALLGGLSRQDYTRQDFEVIVVDDGGEGSCRQIALEFDDRLNITLLEQDNSGPGAARNLGVKRATGRYLVFTDDDCLPRADWLRIFSERLSVSPDAIHGGRTINRLAANPYCEATQLLLDYLYENYNPETVLGGFFTANNLALSRGLFLEFGGFSADLRFGEDREFCYRCALQGCRFVYVPEAVIEHSHKVSLVSFLMLHFNYGYGTFKFRRDCSIKGFPSVVLSPLSWYMKLIARGIESSRTPSGLALSILLGLTQASAAVGYFWGALKSVGIPKSRRSDV